MRRVTLTVAGTCILWGMGVMSAWGQSAAGAQDRRAVVPRLIRFSGTVRPVGE